MSDIRLILYPLSRAVHTINFRTKNVDPVQGWRLRSNNHDMPTESKHQSPHHTRRISIV
jgi:hypothetical protein